MYRSQLGGDGIKLPTVFRECIDYLEENGKNLAVKLNFTFYVSALEHEGLYRLAAVKSHILAVKALYNKGITPNNGVLIIVNLIVFCLKGILSTCQNMIQTRLLVCSNCFSESSRNLSFHRSCFLDSRQLLVSCISHSLTDSHMSLALYNV